MRLLFCSHNNELEGAPKQLMQIANMLKNHGKHECVVLAPKKGPLKESGLAQVTIRSLYKNPTSKMARNILKKLKPDLILINTILGYKLIQEFNAVPDHPPIVWLIHESERTFYFDKYKDLTPQIFATPTKVVFPCKTTQKIYEDLDTGNFQSIYNGIDAMSFATLSSGSDKHALRVKHNLPTDALIVTSVGSFCFRKSQIELIDAGIEFLTKVNNPEVHFLLVGKMAPAFAPHIDSALKRADELKLKERFHIRPETTEIKEIYALSDIAICNSYIEAFPLVTLEAMASGLPVIATEIYGISEQLEQRKTGMLVLPGNKRELIDAIETLISDREFAVELGRNAQRYVLENFTKEKQYQKYEALINNVTKSLSLPLSPASRSQPPLVHS
ncbi:MAG: glycosyltransferase family 4 protein [Candidatus Peribacteraceae bacterium]|jgi:glycosyltransferase involved in cell wall biosynthesis|nr:glycosyltransferase family 4 protein [Candidatus Peribacteraceae bacterium]|tara:strand:+ start:6436 stop:7599 length:1164 start_codon:yes stop_codon:yes gene_type:complete